MEVSKLNFCAECKIVSSFNLPFVNLLTPDRCSQFITLPGFRMRIRIAQVDQYSRTTRTGFTFSGRYDEVCGGGV